MDETPSSVRKRLEKMTRCPLCWWKLDGTTIAGGAAAAPIVEDGAGAAMDADTTESEVIIGNDTGTVTIGSVVVGATVITGAAIMSFCLEVTVTTTKSDRSDNECW